MSRRSVPMEAVNLLDLPTELLITVLQYLDSDTLNQLQIVCTTLWDLVNSPPVWRERSLSIRSIQKLSNKGIRKRDVQSAVVDPRNIDLIVTAQNYMTLSNMCPSLNSLTLPQLHFPQFKYEFSAGGFSSLTKLILTSTKGNTRQNNLSLSSSSFSSMRHLTCLYLSTDFVPGNQFPHLHALYHLEELGLAVKSQTLTSQFKDFDANMVTLVRNTLFSLPRLRKFTFLTRGYYFDFQNWVEMFSLDDGTANGHNFQDITLNVASVFHFSHYIKPLQPCLSVTSLHLSDQLLSYDKCIYRLLTQGHINLKVLEHLKLYFFIDREERAFAQCSDDTTDSFILCLRNLPNRLKSLELGFSNSIRTKRRTLLWLLPKVLKLHLEKLVLHNVVMTEKTIRHAKQQFPNLRTLKHCGKHCTMLNPQFA